MKSCRILKVIIITALLLTGVSLYILFSRSPGKPVLIVISSAVTAVSLLSAFHACALFRQRERYKLLVRNTSEMLLNCDDSGRIRECLTGGECGDNLFTLFPESHHWEIELILKAVSRMPAGSRMGLQMVCSIQNNENRFYSLIMENMEERPFLKGISVTVRDVSEARRLEHRLIRSRENAYREARHDPLTSIPNRLYFTEAVTRRFARLKRRPEETLWILMIDLDHFKKVNDTFGHDVGDRVLIKLTELCSGLIRGSDVFARYGGEEFICSMDDLSRQEALDAAERMRNKVEEHREWPGDILLTISIGLAEYSGEEEPGELIKKSDIALYKAKALGRNRVCIYLAHND